MTIDSFARNGLRYVQFDEALFDATIGTRFRSHGPFLIALRDKAQKLVFLPAALSSHVYSRVNASETLGVAESAQSFRNRLEAINIRESFEPLAQLDSAELIDRLGWRFSDKPFHAWSGEFAGRRRVYWVRQSVLDMLVGMSEALMPFGYSLLFMDAFRPSAVQTGLFARRIEIIRQSRPSWSKEEIVLEAKTETAFTPRFAAHMAGAAIDIRIIDLVSREPIDIGNEYPEGGAVAQMESPFVTQIQWQNRQILAYFASEFGFAVYPFEDWHVSFRDATYVAVRGDETTAATYGPIVDFDQRNGAIRNIFDVDHLDDCLSILHFEEG